MHSSIDAVGFSPVARHIQLDLDSHALLLAVRQITIPGRVLHKFLIIQSRCLPWIDGDQLILLIPMPDKTSSPLPSSRPRRFLFPEEAEAAVGLSVDLAPVNKKTLRDGGFHFGDGPEAVGSYIAGGAMAAVHDEVSPIEIGLGDLDEVLIPGLARPGGVDVGIGMEDGF